MMTIFVLPQTKSSGCLWISAFQDCAVNLWQFYKPVKYNPINCRNHFKRSRMPALLGKGESCSSMTTIGEKQRRVDNDNSVFC